MSKNNNFADRIINVAVTGPLVRLELGALKPATVQGQKPELNSTGTLVMPLDGFLASFSTLEAVVRKLMVDGIVKSKPTTLDPTDRITDTPQ